MIVWGKKIKRIVCADSPYFCAICRSLVDLKTFEVRRVPHVYFIPLGNGDYLLDEGTCEGCRTVYGFEPGLLKPLRVTPGKSDGLKYLSDQPSLNNEGRAALEERVANQQITGDERQALLAEPFRVLQYDLQRRASSGGQESLTAVLTFLLIVFAIGAAMCWHSYLDRREPEWLPWAIGCTVGAVAMLVWVWMRVLTSLQRAASGEFVERIAASLSALKPHPSEVEWTMAELKKAGNPVAEALTTEQVLRQLGLK